MVDMRVAHTSVMAFTQWVAFVEVCRTGSIGGAAAVLGYTQSAVSRQVATLEADLQVQLLERLPRGVRPTAAGEALLHHARIVVNEVERGRVAARRAPAVSATLTVGAVPSAAAALVPQALRRLDREGEGALQWSIVPGLTADLVAMVRQRELDVAVVTDAPPGLPADPLLRLTHVGDDEPAVVVPADHRLAGAAGSKVGFAELAEERWIEDNAGSEALLRAMAARAGVEPWIDRSATDLLTKTGLVAAGHGVGLVPGSLVPALRADVRVLRLAEAPRRGIYVLDLAGAASHDALVAALVGALDPALDRDPDVSRS
jgi:DNA-binding transcriptional LysR family regulator